MNLVLYFIYVKYLKFTVAVFIYLGTLISNDNSVEKEI